MKKRNWIKRWGITLLLLLMAVLVVSFGSMAAYTNFNSVKKVVSTGKPNDTLFSSNYLYLVTDAETNYSTRRITPATDGDYSTFTVQIYNYVYGNPSAWNTENIQYSFVVKIMPRSDGNNLPAESGNIVVQKGETEATKTAVSNTITHTITSTLSSTSASQDSYAIKVPTSIKDQIKMEITATPTDSTKTSSKKLAAIISMATLETVSNWTGKFLDSKNNQPLEYDGYNYEISGNGEGTVTLEWNSAVLQASVWFTDGHTITTKEENYKSITFDVGDDSAFQLQFYRVPGATIPDDWNGLESCVKVSFAPKTNGSESGS